MLETLLSAFLLGILGSGHCLGMCGGLSSALGLQSSQQSYVLSYHLGRVVSYTMAGIFVGLIGFWFAEYLGALTALRALAAIMLILMGFYLAGWFNGLILSEKLGSLVWRRLQPLGKRYLRPSGQAQAICLGLVWGWLPCGLVYSSLIYASSQAHWFNSALTMLCFGIGTLPSMLGVSFMGKQATAWLNSTRFRKAAGIALLIYGVWSLTQLVHFYQ
ncbi:MULTISPECIES: sulfite exporter TauE/SafE family protein [unclassified Oleiphilus]|uniref:sulfite exporter TauE/SafE family protein n=1 Tax=unclassified Oleiphilus TaxID=2631174 RepID=UPI000838C71B|nr:MULTISPECIES: sulfite exporter TauE/SafE family protein [unclassified Oleiphilus]